MADLGYDRPRRILGLSSTARQIIFWVLIIAGALLIYKLVNPGGKNTANIDLTQLDQKIKDKSLKQIVVKQTEVVAIDKNSNVEYAAVSADFWFLDIYVAADAVGRQQGSVVWQVARETAEQSTKARDL
jgi:hypothetical protein